jgi:Ca-activated chloride channel family protein
MAAILAPFTVPDANGQAQQQAQQPGLMNNPYLNQRAAAPALAEAVPFAGKNGLKKGWKITLPGKRPLATPAVAAGKVFLGGGFGSHEFYSFDALTGKLLKQYRTKDDGPTAAVVAGDLVAFNTESCELEILTLDLKPVWKHWLGDPLMSMPAIADGKVFMAYPDSKGNRQHHLACFDLKTGQEFWKQPIAGEIITAPVVAENQVFLATLEGTLFCFRLDGSLVWKEQKNATSAPTVWNNQCFFSRRDETTLKKDGQEIKFQNEELAFRFNVTRAASKTLEATRRQADYLDYTKRARSPIESANKNNDAGVGFATAKGDAKIGQALGNLGQATVAGVWAYQGSRPFVYKDRLYSAMGDVLKCVEVRTGKLLWKKDLGSPKDRGELLDAVLTPPVLVNGKVFLGTAAGDLLCLAADTGATLWSTSVGEPISFQPAVAGGRIFLATALGSLICLETGDPKDDGWFMWGATAGHNGISEW